MNSGDELVQEITRKNKNNSQAIEMNYQLRKKLALISTHAKILFIFIESTKTLLLLIYQ